MSAWLFSFSLWRKRRDEKGSGSFFFLFLFSSTRPLRDRYYFILQHKLKT